LTNFCIYDPFWNRGRQEVDFSLVFLFFKQMKIILDKLGGLFSKFFDRSTAINSLVDAVVILKHPNQKKGLIHVTENSLVTILDQILYQLQSLVYVSQIIQS
jgi:hypothetical protein